MFDDIWWEVSPFTSNIVFKLFSEEVRKNSLKQKMLWQRQLNHHSWTHLCSWHHWNRTRILFDKCFGLFWFFKTRNDDKSLTNNKHMFKKYFDFQHLFAIVSRSLICWNVKCSTHVQSRRQGEKYYPMTYLFWRHALKIVDCLTFITDYFQQAMACRVDV